VINSKPAVTIKNLNFFINQNIILKDINISIKKGEFVGLVGPNGAGKTTLLKCINGLNKAEGHIELNGVDIRRMNDKRIAREIALMNQNTAINFSLPTIDVVMMGRYPYLKRMETEGKKDYQIARSYMKYTDTLKLEKRNITQISGGERQRTFLAKVLTQDTGIILLDEPTASLDITFQDQIFRYSRELSDSGKTVIAAVHDLKIASRYCSRLILMKEGEIIADGGSEEVLISDNLSKAYGVNALVYKNSVTGLLDFHIYWNESGMQKGRAHVIGGGGSASGVIRQLFEGGYQLSAGVFAHGDSDLNCAEVFGIKRLECSPFSDINENTFNENVKMIEESDFTILCNTLFGNQNQRNLEAARFAKKLIIIEDDAPESRDFTEGKAMKIYNEIKESAIITTTARLHEVL
jgi:iron complex transport system ATP-binding protein